MKAYVISLNEPKKKMEYLKTFDIEPIWFKGVNGNREDITQTDLYKRYINSSYAPRSAIGCALSHIKAWEDFVKRDDKNEEYLMIFEDDVVLEENFKNGVEKALENVPADYDILYLGCFGCIADKHPVYEVSTMLYGKNKRHGIVNQYIAIPEVSYATHAYIISKQGANRLLSLMKGKVDDHIDMLLSSYAASEKINTYVTTPRLAFQTSTDTGISENVKAIHPSIITSLLRHVELDRMAKADYLLTVSIKQFGDYMVNTMSIIFLITGLICAYNQIDIKYLSLFYLLISLPDFQYIKDNKNMRMAIIVNYFLFMTPSLLFTVLRR